MPAKELTQHKLTTHELSQYMGLGKVKAAALIAAGVKSVKDLRLKKYSEMLPASTAAFIKYKPLDKIPRAIIDKVNNKVQELSQQLNLSAGIYGSYMRQAAASSDIDLLITADVPQYKQFIEELKKKYKMFFYHTGDNIQNAIIQLKPKVYGKIDIFRTDKAAEIPAILYLTGSGLFNIRMRAAAKRAGYTLNQNGLFKAGKITNLKTERDYFDILKLKYVEPAKR